MRIPILLISALALASPAIASPTSVQIDLASFSIAPRPIHLAAGRPVRLVFTNRSGGGHDFTARAFFAAARDVRGAVADGEVELAGHQTVVVDLIPARGTFKAHCGHFGHKLLGMTGTIVVD
jgi:uncharacterized cupredoxin-like copper-binding protein